MAAVKETAGTEVIQESDFAALALIHYDKGFNQIGRSHKMCLGLTGNLCEHYTLNKGASHL